MHGDKLLAMTPEERFDVIVGYGLPHNIEKMQKDLARYKIHYDVWFRESTLHESGAVAETVQMLTDAGVTYEQDGALWLRSTAFGAEKDDVLRRANGFYTYFAADIAYHRNKFVTRGFDRVINIWGADTTAMWPACSAPWTPSAWMARTAWRSCSCSSCA